MGRLFTLSLPRVINFNFSMQPYQKYNISQYRELGFRSFLRWKMIILPIITTPLIYFFMKTLREYTHRKPGGYILSVSLTTQSRYSILWRVSYEGVSCTKKAKASTVCTTGRNRRQGLNRNMDMKFHDISWLLISFQDLENWEQVKTAINSCSVKTFKSICLFINH